MLDAAKLTDAMMGQDVVYANLAGDLVPMGGASCRRCATPALGA